MRISELCQRGGTSKALVRHYESLGLLHSTSQAAGSRHYRDFPEESLRRLELIAAGKEIGLTLKQIQPLLDAFLTRDMTREEALAVLDQQLRQIEQVLISAARTKALIEHRIEEVKAKPTSQCFKA
ncbi:MAG: MerR family transcriptional regulator [Pseudomonadales bacterium]